jgi:hypothetical protein
VCPVRTRYMPIELSATTIAGGDRASAVTSADMAMATRTTRTKSLIPDFAPFLETSFGNAGHAGNQPMPKSQAASRQSLTTDARGFPKSESDAPMTPPQAPQSFQSVYTYELPGRSWAVPDPRKDQALLMNSAPADETNSTTLAAPSLNPGSSQVHGFQTSTAPEIVSTYSTPITSSALVPSLQTSSRDTSPNSSFPIVAPVTEAPVQSQQGLAGSTLSGAPAQATPNAAEPTVRGDSVVNTTVQEAQTMPAQSIPTQPTSAVMASPAAPVQTKSNAAEPAMRVDSVFNAPVQQAQITAAGAIQPEPASTDLASPVPPVQTTPNAAEPTVLGEVPSSAVFQEAQTMVADASEPQFTSAEPASVAPSVQTTPDPPRATTPFDVAPSTISQSAGIAGEASNQAPNQAAQPPEDVASIGLSAFASVSASSQESPADPIWIAKSATAALTETVISALGNSKSAAASTVAPAADRKEFSREAVPDASEASAPSLNSLQQELSSGVPVIKIKTETPTTTATAPFPQFTISRETGTASVKLPSVTTPLSTSDSAFPNIVSVSPTTSDEMALPAFAIPVAAASDEGVATEISSNTSTIGVTASTEPDDSQADGNSQAPNPAKSSDFVSTTLSASVAADPSALTQAVSVAVTAPKSDPSGATAIGAPSNTNTASDASLTGSTAPHRAAGGPELSEAMQAWNGGDNAQTRFVQSARLGGNLRESEMNIAMQTETLGAVELRARVSGDVVGAAIGIERHDAHAMISNDLPSLHEALHDRQLRVGNVTVYQGSLHSGVATGDGGKSSQQRETAPQQPANSFWTSAQSPMSIGAAGFSESSEGNMIFDSNGRLSVRA